MEMYSIAFFCNHLYHTIHNTHTHIHTNTQKNNTKITLYRSNRRVCVLDVFKILPVYTLHSEMEIYFHLLRLLLLDTRASYSEKKTGPLLYRGSSPLDKISFSPFANARAKNNLLQCENTYSYIYIWQIEMHK